ncbi:MAG: hypothetical protein FWG74_01480 [Planctomycetes bacterium]|nr:hypothetical protein [Planctomycetota bacterium]
MAISGVGGANDIMLQLMHVLLRGMQEQMAMSQKMIAVGVEDRLAADKMALAQSIIDVYA